MNTDRIIANGVQNLLKENLTLAGERQFFRLEGFSDQTYGELITQLREHKAQLGGTNLELRSTAPLQGHLDIAADPKVSAVHYRNSLPKSHALVLIVNETTSDEQSLKDLYPVNEALLTGAGKQHLIDAAFEYDLSPEQNEALGTFIKRFTRAVRQPQLTSLANFLSVVSTFLLKNPGNPLSKGVSNALPHLGLFRSDEIGNLMTETKVEALLKRNATAARLGHELLDEQDEEKYLKRLKEAEFEDEAEFGGPSRELKKRLLEQFLTEVVSDQITLQRILSLNWFDVAPILDRPRSSTKRDSRIELGRDLETLIEARQIDEGLSSEAQAAVDDLVDGKEPDSESLDSLGAEIENYASAPIKQALARLKSIPKVNNTDFLVGLLSLLTKLRSRSGAQDTLLRVRFIKSDAKGKSAKRNQAEAFRAFKTLYGGLDTLLTEAEFDFGDIFKTLVIDEEDEDAVVKVSLHFKVLLGEGIQKEQGDLYWLYRSSGSAAATTLNLMAEVARLSSAEAGVPIYTLEADTLDITDLDLSDPIKSLGAWYRRPDLLRSALEREYTEYSDEIPRQGVMSALDELDNAWGVFIHKAGLDGLLAADVLVLLKHYEAFLDALTQVDTQQDLRRAYREATKAWLVLPTDLGNWAVMPSLHPLKLYWWTERVRHLNQHVAALKRGGEATADAKQYAQELTAVYNSGGQPALLALASPKANPRYFLPVLERDGFELFRLLDNAALAYGLSDEDVHEDEGVLSAGGAAKELARVVRDYVETYPFVQDGLEVFFLRCRNSSLPGLFIQELDKHLSRRNPAYKLNLVVHTEDQGAPIYNQVTTWLSEHPQFSQRADSFFPKVTLKVLECPLKTVFKQVEDTDIVILPDVLAEKGLEVHAELKHLLEAPENKGGLPLYTVWQAPHFYKDQARDVQLNAADDAHVVRKFHDMQYTARVGERLDKESVIFSARSSLKEWEEELTLLHENFNWVICYDTTIDRFLLESTVPDAAEVIRYSVGLGPQRRHNLTVSASRNAQDIVTRRLATRLTGLLHNTPDSFRWRVAQELINEAKGVSGDLVLRAAGPGAFLNELIGVVASKHVTQLKPSEPKALNAWLYLDDVTHWFEGGKFPDLLYISLIWEGGLTLEIDVIEAKCVTEGSAKAEAIDAKRQVRQGMGRLKRVWADGEHLDKPYWINQLFQNLVSNLSLKSDQRELWETMKEPLKAGEFKLKLHGHTWVFCYDGNPGLGAGANEHHETSELEDGQPYTLHLYNRQGLRSVLRSLADDWELEMPSGIWDDLPPTAPLNAQKSLPKSEAVSPTMQLEVKPTSKQDPVQQREHHNKNQHNSVDALEPSEALIAQALALTQALSEYGVEVFPIDPKLADVGPNIIRYKLRLRPGEQIKRVQKVADDLIHRLALTSTPIIDAVLGTPYVGVDLPNPEPRLIELAPLLKTLSKPGPGELPFVVGQAPNGEIVTSDLSNLPHLLVGGTTGSGKSVFLRSMLLSFLSSHTPETLELLIVDPKRTDFSFFNDLSHLRGDKVIVDNDEAAEALIDLARGEMISRQEKMAGRSMNLKEFNELYPDEAMPVIVALIDEYAQLAGTFRSKSARDEFEGDLKSLAGVARATGIHLVLATQRPDAEILNSTLKANLPASIAFRVASATNSRVVLDQGGAENLLGNGDLLFKQPSGHLLRLQAPFLSTKELVEHLNQVKR